VQPAAILWVKLAAGASRTSTVRSALASSTRSPAMAINAIATTATAIAATSVRR
jgi:hypothetical protein